MVKKYREYRGCDKLMFALVTSDDNDTGDTHGYKTGTLTDVAGVQEISVEVSADSAQKYYDNKPVISLISDPGQSVTFTVSVLDPEVEATLTGQYYDSATGMLVENAGTPPDVAIVYQLTDTDGNVIDCAKMKGKFSYPGKDSKTKDDSTDTNNMELTYTPSSTVHEFAKGGSCFGFWVDDSLGLSDLSTFFTDMPTPDTITVKTQG